MVARTRPPLHPLPASTHSSVVFGSPPRTLCLLRFIPLSSTIPHGSVFSISTSLTGTTRCTHGIRAHVSHTQNSYPCMQPNKITSRIGSTIKTTKHDWVHGLSMHLTILDRLSIPSPHHQSNQSPLVEGTTPDTHDRPHGLRPQGRFSPQDEALRGTTLLGASRKTPERYPKDIMRSVRICMIP